MSVRKPTTGLPSPIVATIPVSATGYLHDKTTIWGDQAYSTLCIMCHATASKPVVQQS